MRRFAPGGLLLVRIQEKTSSLGDTYGGPEADGRVTNLPHKIKGERDARWGASTHRRSPRPMDSPQSYKRVVRTDSVHSPHFLWITYSGKHVQ